MISRTPIVTILGHVDHGKTTILDYIRNAHVQAGEVGGITQKISAFTIDVKGKKITFVDTPGHEAFDLMRSRGGAIADIVLLIVAASDGVQPQTEESIQIIKKSKAKPIVVINKVDLPGIDLEKVKRDVTNKGLQLEGLGGTIPVVEVSGKTGKNIELLLETISLVAEVEGLQVREPLSTEISAKGYVLESIKDKSKGNVSTVIITQGKLEKGMWIGYMSKTTVITEKVKGIINEDNQPLEFLDEGYGGKIMGLSEMISLGSEFLVTKEKDEKAMAVLSLKEEVVTEEEKDNNQDGSQEAKPLDLSALFGQVSSTEEKKTFKVIIKASSEGALEALRKSLNKVEEEGYSVEIIQDGLGDIGIRDVEMASVTKAIILGFEVGLEKGAQDLARSKKVLVRSYDLIYKLVDEISDAILAISSPTETEEEIGSADVKAIFTLSDGTTVIGCKVNKGIVKKGGKAYIVRKDDIVLEGRIESLKHEKTNLNEAGNGTECGVILNTKGDVQIGDILYCYKIIK